MCLLISGQDNPDFSNSLTLNFAISKTYIKYSYKKRLFYPFSQRQKNAKNATSGVITCLFCVAQQSQIL